MLKKDPVHILLVEDDEVDIMNIRRAFRKNEVENTLHIAHDGLEALDMLKEKGRVPRPCVLLLDINMPRMNGFELIEELRGEKDLASIQVFIMSTSNEESDKKRAFELGVAGYFVKPLSLQKFNTAIKTLVDYLNACEYPRE